MYNNYNLIEFFRGGGKKRAGRPVQFRGALRAGLMVRKVTNMELRMKLKTLANIHALKLARDAAYMTLTRTETPLYNRRNPNDTLGRLGYSVYPNSRVGRYKLNYTGEAPQPSSVAEFVPVSNPLLVTSRPSAELFLGAMALLPVARTMRIGNINGKKVLIPVAAAAVGLGGAGLAYMANNYDYIDGTTSAAPVNPNSPVSPNNPNNTNNPNEPMVIYMPPDAPGSESRPYELDGTTVYGLRPNAVGSENNPYGLNEVTVYGNTPVLLVSTDSTNIYLSPDGSTWIEPISLDNVLYINDSTGVQYIKRPPYDLNIML